MVDFVPSYCAMHNHLCEYMGNMGMFINDGTNRMEKGENRMRNQIILLSLVGGIFVLKGYDTWHQLTKEERLSVKQDTLSVMLGAEALAQSVANKLDEKIMPLTQRVMSVPAPTVVYKDRVVYRYKTKIVRRVEFIKPTPICHRLKLRNGDGSGWNVRVGCSE